jgi:hypothetical protein
LSSYYNPELKEIAIRLIDEIPDISDDLGKGEDEDISKAEELQKLLTDYFE